MPAERKAIKMTSVVVKTPQQLHAWRQELLARTHMTWEELDERAKAYTLTAKEQDIWETIKSIEFLLGNDG